MKLIDANVLMYAIGKAHPLKAPSFKFLEAVTKDKIRANIDIEALQEILHIYHRRKETEKGLLACDRYLLMFPNPITVDTMCIRKGRDMLGKYPHLAARDAVHIGVVLTYQLEGIVSVDKHFDRVKEIRRFDPREIAE